MRDRSYEIDNVAYTYYFYKAAKRYL